MLSLAAAIGFRLVLTTPMADLQPPEPVAAKVLQTGGASEGDTLPLVIALHGRGGDPGSMASVLARLDVPARVVVPRAPLRSGKGWAWFRPRARAADQERFGDAVRTAGDDLAALVEGVVAEHPTCGGVTVVGFSQGGMVALAYAGAHPETVDQVVAIAAWVPEALQPDASVRVTLLHGEDDRRVPYRWARGDGPAPRGRGRRGRDAVVRPHGPSSDAEDPSGDAERGRGCGSGRGADLHGRLVTAP